MENELVLKGEARRAHLAQIGAIVRAEIFKLVSEQSGDLSYNEVYGEIIAAVEENARVPIEIVKGIAEICREEFCREDGGSSARAMSKIQAFRAIKANPQMLYWDAEDTEVGYEDFRDLGENLGRDDAYMQVQIAELQPNQWLAYEVTEVDEKGEPEGWDLDLFETEDEAKNSWEESLSRVRKQWNINVG